MFHLRPFFGFSWPSVCMEINWWLTLNTWMGSFPASLLAMSDRMILQSKNGPRAKWGRYCNNTCRTYSQDAIFKNQKHFGGFGMGLERLGWLSFTVRQCCRKAFECTYSDFPRLDSSPTAVLMLIPILVRSWVLGPSLLTFPTATCSGLGHGVFAEEELRSTVFLFAYLGLYPVIRQLVAEQCWCQP